MNKIVAWVCAALFKAGSVNASAADAKPDRVLVTEAFHSTCCTYRYILPNTKGYSKKIR